MDALAKVLKKKKTFRLEDDEFLSGEDDETKGIMVKDAEVEYIYIKIHTECSEKPYLSRKFFAASDFSE